MANRYDAVDDLIEHCTLDKVLAFVAARDEVRRMAEIDAAAPVTISNVAPTLRAAAMYVAEADPFPPRAAKVGAE